ncbi:MAG: hydroxymethylbilane synthase [Erysipelotrichaceae bacterium]|nr:hydroxymethylbilane synthase [Erysipelotrichaceae bacterium]
MKIVLGSRGSKLALIQTQLVLDKLKQHYPENEYEIKVIHTKGDKILNQSLEKIGDKGLFVKEIEQQLLDKEIDIAVHSMKDMPSQCVDGLVFTDTLENADCRDCLVLNGYHSLNELPTGATIATGSKRRKFQLLKLRPDLNIVDIRGNIHTRIQKMYDNHYDGLVLAVAGVERIDRKDLISEYLDPHIFVPACAQGMLGIEVRKNDALYDMINAIADKDATYKMKLERTFLETINGSCHIPMGAYIEAEENKVHVDALLGNEEGKMIKETCLFDKDHAFIQMQQLALKMKGQIENE